MSTAPQPARRPAPVQVLRPRRRWLRRALVLLAVLLPLAAGGLGLYRLYRTLGRGGSAVPVARVRRGEVTFVVNANGELKGGNPESLAAPMTGEGEMQIKTLKKDGDLVNEGDVVIEFDTSDQQYRLKEAESDLAEAEQQVTKAKAEAEALQEENAYSLLKAKSDVRLAELEVRRNPLVSAIAAKQNDLALAAARDRLAEIEKDLAHRSASNQAAVEIQLAARSKAETAAATARRNIEQMTVKAHRQGYVSIRQNTNTNFYYTGMVLPPYRVGDRVRPGMVVAEIPDLEHWEISSTVDELDRGHLAPGQAASVQVPALPFTPFHAKVKNIGGTAGSPWEPRFECRLTLDNARPELRPGMNVRLAITTEVMRGALWIPAQALFEADGRTFVYVPSGSGFAPRDVKLVRRSESQAVITGLGEGQAVALASPDEQAKKTKAAGGAMKAIPK